MTNVLFLALGPTVGGVGVSAIGWRWMFAILIPFLVIAGFVGAATIRQPRPTERVRFRWVQLVLLMIGFMAFVSALDRAGASITALTSGEPGASGTLVFAAVLFLVSSVGALVWFASLSKRSTDLLIHMGVLRSVPFRWHLLAYVMLEGVTIGFGYLIPNLAQLGFGSTTTVAGLLILPGALLGAVLAPVGGALLDRFRPDAPDSLDDGACHPGHHTDAAHGASDRKRLDDLRRLHRVHDRLLDGLSQYDDRGHERHFAAHAAGRQRHVQHVPAARGRRRYDGDVHLPGCGAIRT
ncbi:MFS transporter [Bifidobacterium italicum]|uniref:MFS transporter n=1 Tax=Bifidobacterium italicum TaxID=1960968 RepID=UPI0010562EBF|nr:MFS transporter [Bifidobacterium italicum]